MAIFFISPLIYLHLHGTDHAANAVALGTCIEKANEGVHSDSLVDL